ncbi:hypothetical protein WH95_10410 [Kiloniella litopenaei]|uniref:DNA alkylation repair protein n=1 Tax=Kiloniella litopenaei TaxID=1549748 RepID=A0A0M2R4R7_9PROT|nr:hypothetical protein [Kiloniella litopenaei]KKJ76842.1 hypothetical protein WH95_10410 [Kiloniella litopenaei]
MLQNSLATWDTKSAEDIRKIYAQYVNAPNFEQDLVASLQIKDLQQGATWLLKHHLCQKGLATSIYSDTLFNNLDLFDEWESWLHILQSFEHLIIDISHKKSVEQFVRNSLKSDNKLIRAWGYHGFYYLSQQFPEYQTEVKSLMQKALLSEAASVKARIRNLPKVTD